MKFYVICPTTRRRINLSLAVERRSQIDQFFTVRCPFDGQTHHYTRQDVIAEPTVGASIGGAVVGGLIGAVLGGPLGALVLGGIGVLTGSSAEEQDRRRVRQFNEE